MKLIIDVAYQNNTAKVVGGFFKNWEDNQLTSTSQKMLSNIEPYVPGEFYKRELPCILSFLADCNSHEIELIIIDGFVYLDDDDKKGLGAYLFEALDQKIPIIGAAKSSFFNNSKNVKTIRRGGSNRPLYISAIGIDVATAATSIASMTGKYRMPDLTKMIDTATKQF